MRTTMLRRGALRYAAGGRGLRRFATRTAPVAVCSYNGTSRSKLGSNASPFSFHSDPRSKVPSLALCEEQGLCLWRQRCHTYSTACTAFGSRSTAAIKIASAKKEGDALLVTWEEEEDRGRGRDGGRFHYVWLRDSCLCAECYHQTTHQRLLDTTRIPADLVALDANVMDGGSCSMSLCLEDLCSDWFLCLFCKERDPSLGQLPISDTHHFLLKIQNLSEIRSLTLIVVCANNIIVSSPSVI